MCLSLSHTVKSVSERFVLQTFRHVTETVVLYEENFDLFCLAPRCAQTDTTHKETRRTQWRPEENVVYEDA